MLASSPLWHVIVALLTVVLVFVPLAGAAHRAMASGDEQEGAECFVSAYYRRVVTKPGFNRISISVTLPNVTIDPLRDRSDGFHIYLGSTFVGPGGASEVDAGLAWEITRDEWGSVDYINRAWRPFFRTSSPVAYINGPATAEYYWYPGEHVTLTYEVVQPGLVTLTVSGEGKKYTFDPVAASGFNIEGNQLLKWVVSLDQSGREGKGPLPTRAQVAGIRIHDVMLTQPGGTAVPLTEQWVHKPRTCLMPNATPFAIEYGTKYRNETITITGLAE